MGGSADLTLHGIGAHAPWVLCRIALSRLSTLADKAYVGIKILLKKSDLGSDTWWYERTDHLHGNPDQERQCPDQIL